MNSNDTLLSHLLVLWQFFNVKKVIYMYIHIYTLLNDCEIFYSNCFRLNCFQIIRWGKLYLTSCFHGAGESGKGLPSTDQEGDIEAEHLLVTFGCQGQWFLWQVTWKYQLGHSSPTFCEVLRFPGSAPPFLELLVSRMASFCFSCFPHKTDLCGYDFAHSWITSKQGLFNYT